MSTYRSLASLREVIANSQLFSVTQSPQTKPAETDLSVTAQHGLGFTLPRVLADENGSEILSMMNTKIDKTANTVDDIRALVDSALRKINESMQICNNYFEKVNEEIALIKNDLSSLKQYSFQANNIEQKLDKLDTKLTEFTQNNNSSNLIVSSPKCCLQKRKVQELKWVAEPCSEETENFKKQKMDEEDDFFSYLIN